MKNHWSECLPEAGRQITNMARSIAALEDQARQYRAQLDTLNSSIRKEEEAIIATVNKEWTDAEIKEAKRAFATGNY